MSTAPRRTVSTATSRGVSSESARLAWAATFIVSNGRAADCAAGAAWTTPPGLPDAFEPARPGLAGAASLLRAAVADWGSAWTRASRAASPNAVGGGALAPAGGCAGAGTGAGARTGTGGETDVLDESDCCRVLDADARGAEPVSCATSRVTTSVPAATNATTAATRAERIAHQERRVPAPAALGEGGASCDARPAAAATIGTGGAAAATAATRGSVAGTTSAGT